MKPVYKRAVSLILALVLLLLTSSCGGASSTVSGTDAQTAKAQNTAESTGEKTVTLAMNSSWIGYNLVATKSQYNTLVSNLIYDRLVDGKMDGTVQPRLAESWDVAEDKTSITFHLNPNAVFHDGVPLTADDVIFTANLIVNPAFNAANRGYFSYFEGTDEEGAELSSGSLGVEKVDDHTVTFHFKKAIDPQTVFFKWSGQFFVFPEHIFGDKTIDELNNGTTWKENMIGSGPLVYEDSIDGERIEFTANKDYYLGAPDFDRFVLRVVESSQLLPSLLTGEVDILAGAGIGDLPIEDWESAKNEANLVAYEAKSYNVQGLVFNNQSEVFSNPNVRRAFSMAINRQAIIDGLIGGHASVLYTPFTEYHPYYDADLDYPTYNPDEAKKILEEEGFDFNRTINFTVPTGNTIRENSAVLIQQDLAAIGVDAQITVYDYATNLQDMKDGKFELGLSGMTGTVEPSQILLQVDCRASSNLPHLDTTFSDLIQDAMYELDSKTKQEKYNKIQELFLEQTPIAYLYSSNNMLAYNKRISDVVPEDFNLSSYRVWEWSVD